MKKLLLLAAFGLLASPAFAQSNTADVDQTGDDLEASVSQSGSTNDADVLQTGRANDVIVGQTGTGNEAFVTQTINLPYSGASIDVDQAGTGQLAQVAQSGASPRAYAEVKQDDGGLAGGNNAAYITQQRAQDDAISVVHQSGASNVATNLQDTGGINESYIYQGQTDDASTGNTATVIQDRSAPGDDASPYKAIANVYQDGTTNDANVNQTLSANAQATVDQDGTSNVADIDQWNTVFVDPSHQASITQAGDRNYGRIQQGGDVEAQNTASITQQGGDDNVAFLDQIGFGGGHSASVFQNGSDNLVQGLGGLNTPALQDGAGHMMMVSQAGDSHVAQIGQFGSGNAATVTQSN